MIRSWAFGQASLDRVCYLAELVALQLRQGDAVALIGDLGAGKTTFARALIRALLGDASAEIPSPTFPLVQAYDVPRFPVAHFDFYRLTGASDLEEIGFADAMAHGVVIVEWPERAEPALPRDRLEIAFGVVATDPVLRVLTLTGHGSFGARLERLREIDALLGSTLAHHAGQPPAIAYLQGDASTRAYARVAARAERFVLMDAPRMPDGPPVRNGLPYSRIAHLAEDVRPFVAIGTALDGLGLSVPKLAAHNIERGLLLIEDLGDLTFGRALAAGYPQEPMWLAAVDVLVQLRKAPPAAELRLPDDTSYRLQRFDRAALEIETSLLLDWYWPAAKEAPCPMVVRTEFEALWTPALDRMLAEPAGLFLRDYHSPNLFWLPERAAPRNVGIIDFQDALAEHWSYDLASLLQDARVDVPASLEAQGLERYCAAVARSEPDFDREAFLAAYAAFGAQRNTRLIGLWVRLLKRDGKSQYLQHMPRTWDYLGRNLAHPQLASLRDWYDRHFPEAVRKAAIMA